MEGYYMAKHLLLLEQMNEEKKPVNWEKYFDVFLTKSPYQVAVHYAPDDYISRISNSDYLQVERKKLITRYIFNDDSFLNILSGLNHSDLRLFGIDWVPDIKEKVDTVDFDSVETYLDLKRMLPAIKQNLYAEEQVIQKITILSSLGVKYVVTRYGEIEILGGLEDSKKSNCVQCLVRFLL
ncbi:hypothetical protein HMPREF0497_0865 [Lentilactobacillus buchneri ATCC 11577]|nr:hypothetical protein HMPREF0497_0865 [Lentilactobacillus buchneri ATCC 11577]